jgi:hypothetical protein
MRSSVRPIPATCWLVPSVTMRRPSSAAAATPTAAAAARPRRSEPLACATPKPEVEHPGPLDERVSDRREDERRRRPEGRGDDVEEEAHARTRPTR